MKIDIRFLLICTITSVLISGQTYANSCPAGCFCLNDGETGTPVPDSSVCEREHPEPDYNQDGFSGGYNGMYGIYGFRNGEFVYENHSRDYTDPQGNYHSDMYKYVFNCPKSHPHSATGSKGLTDCFKYDESGTKIYYGTNDYRNCDIDQIRTTVENLRQSLLEVAQDLQNALNTSNANSGQSAQINSDLDRAKQIIDSKITSSVQIQKPASKSGLSKSALPAQQKAMTAKGAAKRSPR